jgi:hypothetical protein
MVSFPGRHGDHFVSAVWRLYGLSGVVGCGRSAETQSGVSLGLKARWPSIQHCRNVEVSDGVLKLFSPSDDPFQLRVGGMIVSPQEPKLVQPRGLVVTDTFGDYMIGLCLGSYEGVVSVGGDERAGGPQHRGERDLHGP